jgi:hypothetical protein
MEGGKLGLGGLQETRTCTLEHLVSLSSFFLIIFFYFLKFFFFSLFFFYIFFFFFFFTLVFASIYEYIYLLARCL